MVSHYLAMCFGMLAVSFARNFAEASLIANLAYTIQSMACGFFVQIDSIPVYVRWTKWISYNFYALKALMANEFTDNFYSCPLDGGINNPGCKEYTGNFVLASLGFTENWIAIPIIINIAWLVVRYPFCPANVDRNRVYLDEKATRHGLNRVC